MKERHLFLLAGLVLTGLMTLSGCGAGMGDEPSVEYAPQEDRELVIYTSHKEEVYRPIIEEFEERTGIWVDVVSGGSNELLKRISEETETPGADVMFGGGADSLQAYEECFSPYYCRDWNMLQAEFRSGDGLWTPFSSLPVVLIYNTKLVEEGQITSWNDLFAPAWQGRIAFCDPGVSGSSFTGLVTLLDVMENGDNTTMAEPDDRHNGTDTTIAETDGRHNEDNTTMKSLAASLDGRQWQSSGQVLDAVADGTDFVGVTLEETAMKRIAAGEDIAIVYPEDGTCSVPDGAALVRDAAHQENAMQFLDFIAGRDVQQLLETQFYRRTVRTDVEPAGVLPAPEEITLMDYDIDKAGREHDAILMSWAFYLGGVDTP